MKPQRPKISGFLPNSDACHCACDAAEDGKWAEALRLLTGDALTGSEYGECSDAQCEAESYVNELAEAAGVDLSTIDTDA